MTDLILNNATGKMERPVSQQTDMEVQGNRRWPAHVTTQQMREQLEWEQSSAFKRKNY